MLPSNVSQFDTQRPEGPRRGGRGGLVVAAIVVVVIGVIIGVVGTRYLNGSLRLPTATAPTAASSARGSTSAAGTPAPVRVATPGSGGTPAPAAPPPTPVQAGTPAADATQTAIQQVIQKGDEEQMQALAANNPTLMQDTATPQFYQEQVQNNQDLIDAGVTDIALLKLEWGPIQVNGNTATATVWETWTTTYADGTTDQSRDRNVYSLVQQNGTWLVQSDDHPDQNQTPTTTQPSAPTQSAPPGV